MRSGTLVTFFLLRGTLSLGGFGYASPVMIAEPKTHVAIVVPGWYIVPTWTVTF